VPFVSGPQNFSIIAGSKSLLLDSTGTPNISPGDSGSVGLDLGSAAFPYGTLYITNKLVVLGTTNFITFGASNTAPTGLTPFGWVSMKISGDTTAYALPFYKY
jgi:hypothetical protein